MRFSIPAFVLGVFAAAFLIDMIRGPTYIEKEVLVEVPVKTFIEVPVEVIVEVPPPVDYTEEDIYYLTEALHFESGVEPTIGKIFVGQVILNRVKSHLWPNTIKDVVHEIKKDGTGQFSYYTDGKPDDMSSKVIEDLRPVVLYILNNKDGIDITEGANHYYNPDLADPYWAEKMDYIALIGDHEFRREIR